METLIRIVGCAFISLILLAVPIVFGVGLATNNDGMIIFFGIGTSIEFMELAMNLYDRKGNDDKKQNN